MARKKTANKRNIALCYVRQSRTRDENDMNSPERQRANIEEVCLRHGWDMEWYEDAEGHKSGRHVRNRPGWLALEKRLGDPDVIALVANDSSRIHRKGWRIGDLLEKVSRDDIHLVFAAPGRAVDTTTIQGRMFLQFGAIIDEYYSDDSAFRSADSVRYRKKQGKTIGMPPFGTTRNADGYLIPSPEGAWLLPDGTAIAGLVDQEPPVENAIWKGYFAALQHALETYVRNGLGYVKLAYHMNEQGWFYRDRQRLPRQWTEDDARRVPANWPEYGGMVFDQKAKDRPAYIELDLETLPWNEQRAVLPIDFLKQVARVRAERSAKPKDKGVRRETFPYALSSITYCAHCEEQATLHDDPTLRSPFGGYTTAKGVQRYRHKRGTGCQCVNKSVPADVIEADFVRLLQLLTIDKEHLDLLTALAIQLGDGGIQTDEEDFQAQKTEAIARARNAIVGSMHLLRRGMIKPDQFDHDVELAEREIAFWESRSSNTEELTLEFAMAVEALDRLTTLWEHGDPEDRQGLVRMLFTSITYNLDARRIVDFKLKPWADRFVILRSELYAEMDEEIGLESGEIGSQGVDTDMPHTGLRRKGCCSLLSLPALASDALLLAA